MIFNPHPATWQSLQDEVCLIMNQVGLTAETNKTVTTPRGEVELDVFAVDKNSVDKIRYVVECKNWANNIPQSVVHAFTTVMQETGGHIGYIIASKGFQEGAFEYLKNTNIEGLTFERFQHKYLPMWLAGHFVPSIIAVSFSLTSYVEPINSRRDRYVGQLNTNKRQLFSSLIEKYELMGAVLLGLYNLTNGDPLANFEKFRELIKKVDSDYNYTSQFFADLLNEIAGRVQAITSQFNDVFGEDIFKDQNSAAK